MAITHYLNVIFPTNFVQLYCMPVMLASKLYNPNKNVTPVKISTFRFRKQSLFDCSNPQELLIVQHNCRRRHVSCPSVTTYIHIFWGPGFKPFKIIYNTHHSLLSNKIVYWKTRVLFKKIRLLAKATRQIIRILALFSFCSPGDGSSHVVDLERGHRHLTAAAGVLALTLVQLRAAAAAPATTAGADHGATGGKKSICQDPWQICWLLYIRSFLPLPPGTTSEVGEQQHKQLTRTTALQKVMSLSFNLRNERKTINNKQHMRVDQVCLVIPVYEE